MEGTLSEAGSLLMESWKQRKVQEEKVLEGSSTRYLLPVAAKFPSTASENSATSWTPPCNSGVILAGRHFQGRILPGSSDNQGRGNVALSAMFLTSLAEPLNRGRRSRVRGDELPQAVRSLERGSRTELPDPVIV